MDYYEKLLFNPSMSNFSTALAVALEKGGFSQASFASKIGMERSLFNRYVLAKFRPTRETLELICKPFDSEQQAKLILAHLEDEIPLRCRNLITVDSPKAGAIAPRRPTVELPSEILGAFEFLMQLAVTKPAISDSILSTARLLGYDSLSAVEKSILSTPVSKLERQKRASEDPDPRKRPKGNRSGVSYSEAFSDPQPSLLNETPPPRKKKK